MTDQVYNNGVEQADIFLEDFPDTNEWKRLLTVEAVKEYFLDILRSLHESEQEEVWDAWLETPNSYKGGALTAAGEHSFPLFAKGFIATVQAMLDDFEGDN